MKGNCDSDHKEEKKMLPLVLYLLTFYIMVYIEAKVECLQNMDISQSYMVWEGQRE